MIEARVEHLIAALHAMEGGGTGALEPRPEAHAAFASEVDARMAGTVWTSGGCASSYLDATGRNATLWPDFTWRFRRRAVRFDPAADLARPRSLRV